MNAAFALRFCLRTHMWKEKNIHRLFQLSLLLKALHALIELAAGFVILFLSTGAIMRVLTYLTRDELAEDPRDVIANYVLAAGRHLSLNTKLFGAAYLLTHGAVNLAIVVGLVAKKLWAYPTGLAVLALFAAYQIYRFSQTHAAGLLLLTALDLLILWLIWHEYRLVRRLHSGQNGRKNSPGGETV